jgi:hypothetical protein
MINDTSLVSSKKLDLRVKRFSIGISASIDKEIQDVVNVLITVLAIV